VWVRRVERVRARPTRRHRRRRRSGTSRWRTWLPNGFVETGTPTNGTLYAQPYRELEIIALAKAYQDAAKHHLAKPRIES
jgi:hypothetical protein